MIACSRRASLLPVFLLSALACLAWACKAPPEKKAAGGKPAQSGAAPTSPTLTTLKLASNEPTYLNPILQTRFNSAIPLVFEGLVGLGDNYEPVPRLAESWEISKDSKTLTFKLRKGVTWHDGKPFTSKDVVFTFDTLRKLEVNTLWKGYFQSVETVEAVDENTVKVAYAQPYAPALVTWTMGIIPAHAYGAGSFIASPANREAIGTGPYKLATWGAGQSMVLSANKQYWGEAAKIENIELFFNVSNQLDALTTGKLDFADMRNIGEWSTKGQARDFRKRFEVTSTVESKIRLIAWNTKKKPFNDARVRRAVTMSLDRGRVIDDVLLGQGQALSAPFFANLFGADRSIAPHAFDLDGAVKLLDEAGYPAAADGKRLSIEIVGLDSLRGAVSDETLAVFRRDMKAIGIELRVTFVTSKEFLTRLKARDFDGFYFGWLPDIPDPDPFSLLHSSQVGAGQNFAGYENPEVDRLLDEARRTLNRDERKVLYQKLHAVLHKELPYTPLYAPYGHYAWNRALRGVNPLDIISQARLPGVAAWTSARK